jgi:hypothetical protein
MNKNMFAISNTITNTISNITAGIAVVLLLFVGTGATTIILPNTAHAQTATIGELFLVEKGKTTAQVEIGPNMTQYTYTANGTMNGNIEVTTTGEYVSVYEGNELALDRGQAVVMTNDGSETANYTFVEVGPDRKGIQAGNATTFLGAAAWNTNSTGQLSFLDNALTIFKVDEDERGNYWNTHYWNTQWLWK